MEVFPVFIAILIAARALVSLVLDRMNRNHALSHADSVPKGMDGYVDMETYARSVRYTVTSSRFASVDMIYDSIVLAIFLFSGVLPWAFRTLEGVLGDTVTGQSAILLIIGLVLDLPGWITDWWQTFRIEHRFGFNNTTQKLWFSDKVKGMLVTSLLMYPLMCLLLLVVRLPLWWFWGFACVFVFQLLLMVLYPMWIMPLFNKFTPLDEGELKDRLMSLAQRTGFAARTILVMDGSRRSGHSNAFFAGIGKSRRIVLFDTLMEQLGHEELEAVLAHEIGHYKLGHVPRMLVVSGLITLLAFGVIGWLAASPWFVMSFGFSYDPQRLAPVFLLFSLMADLALFWFTPLGAMFSRRHEYQADHFALKAMQNDPEPLVQALRKLQTSNLGNMMPHPVYSAFHYSHPTLAEREAALRRASEAAETGEAQG